MVSAHLGVMIRSTVGSSARFIKKQTRSSAPVSANECWKNEASRLVMPIAPNTIANSSPLMTLAFLTI